ncbi:MAG: hypothetical protein ACRECJ_07910, partial [Limisphaerales bacterium]
MKTLFAVALVLLAAVPAFGQAPHPGDSIILESKTVAPGFHGGSALDTAAYLYVKVYITNVDSLTYLTLALEEVSTSGGAYGILGYPRSFTGIITPLTPYFRGQMAAPLSKYNNTSPDSFLVASGFDPADPSTIAPPFNIRTAIWEIKFDSVRANAGTFELDSATVFGLRPTFTNTGPTDKPVNFVKSVITVRPVPDARDSVILESKTVVPGAGQPYTTVTVYITNKDSLTYMTLPLIAKSTSGGAYGVLPKNSHGLRTFGAIITPLGPSLRFIQAANTSRYKGSSPDTFLVGAGFDPAEPDTSIEPPNSVRKAVWQIKFDTIYSNLGTFELDSTYFYFNFGPTFTNTEPRDMPTHFVKSVITVAYPKGDLNQDVALSPADVVLILNCVMLGTPPTGGISSCDLNCDGMGTPADVVLELNAVFLQEPFP